MASDSVWTVDFNLSVHVGYADGDKHCNCRLCKIRYGHKDIGANACFDDHNVQCCSPLLDMVFVSLDGDGANLGVAWWIITVVTPWYEKSEPSVVLSQGSVVAATSCLMGQGAAALRVGPRTRGHALWLLRAATVSVGPASSVKTRIHGPSGPIRTALPPPPTPRLVEGRGAATDPAPWGGVRPDSPAGGHGPSPSRQARAEIAPLAWP